MKPIVIELPAAFMDLAKAIREVVAVTLKAFERGPSGRAVEYAGVEVELAAATGAVERAAHGLMLSALDIDVPHVVIEGARYSRVGRYEQNYYTMAGAVAVERSVFRRDGERNGKVVDAVSLRAGVVDDGWLPHTAPWALRRNGPRSLCKTDPSSEQRSAAFVKVAPVT